MAEEEEEGLPSFKVKAPGAATQESTDTQGRPKTVDDPLPLADFRGLPFDPDSARPSSGGGLPSFVVRKGGDPEPYLSTPPSKERLANGIDTVMRQATFGSEVSPWATQTITSNLQRLSSSPEAAYVLSHPDIIERWQSALWTGALDGMSQSVPGMGPQTGGDKSPTTQLAASFFKVHESTFSTEEREYLLNLLAAVPNGQEILEEKGIRRRGGNALWGDFVSGLAVLRDAPEAIRPLINDPRHQIIAEAHQWLTGNKIDTMQERESFFVWITQKAQGQISDVGSNSGGFFAVAQQTVGFVPDVFLNEANDWLARTADPEGYSTRQHLSLGMNVALGLGIDPSEDHYNTVAGYADAFGQIYLDPQNLVFGLGAGIKAASSVPRTISRGRALALAFNPFGGKALDLDVLDRSFVSRLSYALFSRNVDDITSTSSAMRNWKWIAQADSATAIAERFPTLRNQRASLDALAEASNPIAVREIVRAGMNGAVNLGADAPLLSQRTAATLAVKQKQYILRRQKWLDDGGSIAGLSGKDLIVPEDIYVAMNEFDEGVTASLARKGPRMGSSDVVHTADIADGTIEIRRAGDSYAAFENGEYRGMIENVTSSNPQMAVEASHRGRGIMSELLTAVGPRGQESLQEAASLTSSARRALGMAVDEMPVYGNSFLEASGGRRTVISQLGANQFSRIKIEEAVLEELTLWLDDIGTPAARGAIESLQSGLGLSDLSDDARRLITQWGDAKGADIMHLGDEMMPTEGGRSLLLHGLDGDEGATYLDDVSAELTEMNQAAIRYNDIRSKTNPHMWIVKDLPTVSWTRRTRQLTSNKGTSDWMRGLRQQGFRMTHRLPKNISLVETGEGATQLRNWVKALGGTDEIANQWGDAFRAANPQGRKKIVLDAMKDVGDQIDNPLLKFGLIDFGEKQGHYTYFYDRAGRELGLGLDGSITPMTLSHFTDTFAMPDAKTLLRSLRRFEGTQSALPRMRMGLLNNKTHKARTEIMQNLRAKMSRIYDGNMQGLADEDFAAMAYADILGGEYGRATGMGYMAKITQMAAKPLRGFHHVFVIAQLAGRPLAWASRVLLEETVRADVMGMPSLWSNPVDYISLIWDNHVIKNLPAESAAQAKMIDGLVTEMFSSGSPNWRRVKEVIPDLDARLANASIDPTDTSRVHAYVSHVVGQSVRDELTTAASLGLQGNITRRALRRNRKTNIHRTKLDKYGLSAQFDWKMDGIDIANRSVHHSLFKEIEAATIPMEFSLRGMTARGRQTYARGYARQMGQMIEDPIVGSFGFSRAIDNAAGVTPTHTGAKLIESASWDRVKHIVDRRIASDNMDVMTEVQKANWYLKQMDEIVETLFGPLWQGDLSEKVRILTDLKGGGTTTVKFPSSSVTIKQARNNYEGFANDVSRLVDTAINEQVMLPAKISAYLDPRFGQQETTNMFRRATDWTMMQFGEKSTQTLHRQPAWLAVHRQYFEHYQKLGWDAETARHAATDKATEIVNYVFFDNKNIPQFLADMNQAVPFFSAMYEVGSTWLYKIPSQNILPIGYMQLTRRVSRTLQGLVKSGLVVYDPESNMMTLNVSSDMHNAKDPVTSALGKTLFQYLRLPVTVAEWIGGVGNLMDGEAWSPRDYGSLSKDGFSLQIGNPLDFTTHGIMAVNQFSIGLTPALQLPLSMGANAVFAQSDERVDTDGMTVQDWILQEGDEADIGQVLRHNREAFIEANGKEAFNRALNDFNFDIETLQMPDSIRLPSSSVWETLIDRSFFPFGRMESGGELLTAISPAAMNHVWRGTFQKLGFDDESELMGTLFGQMSNYQVAGEVISQLQMLEASEGVLTRSKAVAVQIQELVAETRLEITKDPEGADRVLDVGHPRALELQELLTELHDLNFDTMKRANDNAGGALIMRGVMGQLGPSTPRMWAREQAQAADYWKTRDLAIEARATGSVNFAERIKGSEINDVQDMERLGRLTQEWMNDPSGDAAKMYMATANPALLAFTQGKSYWGPAGPPPEAKGFDAWVDQLESKDREPFDAEVWMARYQRAGIAIDKQIAITTEYGIDPDLAVQKILADYGAYKALVEPFDMQYEALEFLDTHLYESRYAAWKEDNLDDLSLYELVSADVRRTTEEVDNIEDLLQYAELTPDEERRINGILNSTVGALNDAIRRQKDLAEKDETWLNPREQVLGRYWDLSSRYYDERSALFDTLEFADNKTQRSLVFDAVRRYNNDWYTSNWAIEGFDGEDLLVPAPQVRAWNSKTQEERQERILKMVGKKPEWLDLFETGVLINDSPQMEDMLPSTIQKQGIYDWASEKKYEATEYRRAHPDEVSEYELQQYISELEEQVGVYLRENGRDLEYAYRKALPIQKLQMGGMLPQSLSKVSPMVNQIVEELNAIEKSPTTKEGNAAFLWLRNYMEGTLFLQNPQAEEDFDRLGIIMYEEPLRSAVYAKLLQGDFFGELG